MTTVIIMIMVMRIKKILCLDALAHHFSPKNSTFEVLILLLQWMTSHPPLIYLHQVMISFLCLEVRFNLSVCKKSKLCKMNSWLGATPGCSELVAQWGLPILPQGHDFLCDQQELKSKFFTFIIGLWNPQFLNMQDLLWTICNLQAEQNKNRLCDVAIGQARQNACKFDKVEQVDLNF